MDILTETEKNIYSRQISLDEIGLTGQEKLKNASILIVGAGGLGCPVLQYLVAAGIGTVGIADGDTVAVSNIHRQILFGYSDIGKPKVEVAKAKLIDLNPLVKIHTIHENITESNVDLILNKYEIVVDCTDNFDTRYLLNDSCQKNNKTLVYASIYKYEGQITVFDFKQNHSLRTLFPQKPDNETIPTCHTLGVINTLPGIIGLFQANEVLKLILELGNVLIGKVLTFNILSMEMCILSYSNSVNNSSKVLFVSSEEFKEILVNELDLQLIDVQEKSDFLQLNVGGQNMPYSSFNLKDLSIGSPVYIICKSGNKSKIIAEKLSLANPSLEIYSVLGGVNGI